MNEMYLKNMRTISRELNEISKKNEILEKSLKESYDITSKLLEEVLLTLNKVKTASIALNKMKMNMISLSQQIEENKKNTENLEDRINRVIKTLEKKNSNLETPTMETILKNAEKEYNKRKSEENKKEHKTISLTEDNFVDFFSILFDTLFN